MEFNEARDMGRLLGMENIGVGTAMKLYSVGIRNPRELKRVGAKEAYQRVCSFFGSREPDLLGILKGALEGKRWFMVK